MYKCVVLFRTMTPQMHFHWEIYQSNLLPDNMKAINKSFGLNGKDSLPLRYLLIHFIQFIDFGIQA